MSAKDQALEMAQHTSDAVLAKAGTVVTIGSGGTAIVGGFTLNQLSIIVGMVGVVVGVCIQWYYRHKLTMVEIRLREEEAERQRIEHQIRIGMMQ